MDLGADWNLYTMSANAAGRHCGEDRPIHLRDVLSRHRDARPTGAVGVLLRRQTQGAVSGVAGLA